MREIQPNAPFSIQKLSANDWILAPRNVAWEKLFEMRSVEARQAPGRRHPQEPIGSLRYSDDIIIGQAVFPLPHSHQVSRIGRNPVSVKPDRQNTREGELAQPQFYHTVHEGMND